MGIRTAKPVAHGFRSDGRLFIADVGDYTQDEVSLAAAGANLGWPLCEGNACQEADAEADADGLTAPIYTYGRENGCAIIGGVTAPRAEQRLRIRRLLQQTGVPAGTRRAGRLADTHAGADGRTDIVIRHQLRRNDVCANKAQSHNAVADPGRIVALYLDFPSRYSCSCRRTDCSA